MFCLLTNLKIIHVQDPADGVASTAVSHALPALVFLSAGAQHHVTANRLKNDIKAVDE